MRRSVFIIALTCGLLLAACSHKKPPAPVVIFNSLPSDHLIITSARRQLTLIHLPLGNHGPGILQIRSTSLPFDLTSFALYEKHPSLGTITGPSVEQFFGTPTI